MKENSPSEIIRITREEATSPHVDDLLKRQMSLRGELGVTRDRRRAWYYQSWFVLMLAGILGAVAAWAIIEPFIADELYIQGTVTGLDPTDALPDRVVEGDQVLEIRRGTEGSMWINGEKIYLLAGFRELRRHGSTLRLTPADLHDGEQLGVYVEYHRGIARDIALAPFVVRDPSLLSPAPKKASLAQLAARSNAASMLFFPLVAGLVGLFVGAADGLICRQPRRALLSGLVGLLVGLVGGLISGIFANVAYTPLHTLATAQLGNGSVFGAFGFVVQMIGRSLAWSVAGMAMGLGQGIALRSQRLLLYGLIGGVIGGLFGGLLFDPIDLILLGPDKPSAYLSRLIGLTVIGAGVGGMIGVVELLARDAWLRMTQGPLAGKEFLLFKDLMTIGSSPKSDVYLFNDPQVIKQHAVIRVVGDECECVACDSTAPLLVNNRPIRRARLRHGDNISIGRTSFVFQRRKS